MCLVRLRVLDIWSGNKLAQPLINHFWNDVDQRMIGSGVTNPIVLSKENKRYAKIYFGTALAYDEGLLKGDYMLADSFFRYYFVLKILINNRNVFALGQSGVPVTATKLKYLVRYIRRELSNLDKDETFLETGVVNWGPLDDTVLPPFHGIPSFLFIIYSYTFFRSSNIRRPTTQIIQTNARDQIRP
jgi:hypothetical protein